MSCRARRIFFGMRRCDARAKKNSHIRRHSWYKRNRSYARACWQQCKFWVLFERITMVSDGRTRLMVSGWNAPITKPISSMRGYHFPSAPPTLNNKPGKSFPLLWNHCRHLVAFVTGPTLFLLCLYLPSIFFLPFFNSPLLVNRKDISSFIPFESASHYLTKFVEISRNLIILCGAKKFVD